MPDSYTNEYLGLLNKFKDEIDRRSDQPLDKLSNFILEKTFGSPARIDLLFAVGLIKAPEKILIERRSRPRREVSLILKANDRIRYGFIWAYPQGKGKIDDKAVREALLSKDRICVLKVPGIIEAAKGIIKTCKVKEIN